MSDALLGVAALVLRTDKKELEKGIASAKSKAQSLGKSFKTAGKSATRNLTLPIIAAGAASAKMAADFEKSLSEITGLVGVSSDQVQAWKKDIIALGPAVGKGPQELAEAMFFITSAGLEGAEALDTLELSAKAAASGLGSTVTVADAMTSAMNAYGTEALDAAAATNVLVGTVREGKASADSIAGSLGAVIPLAAEMGVRFDQVGASIAAMTRLGSTAEESATSLTALMAGLKKPTSDAEAALDEVGLSSAGLRRQIKEGGLLDVLLELKEKFKDNDTAMTRVFPNIRALKAVLGLVGENAEITKDIFASLADNTTALDDAFAAASGTATFKMNAAMARLKGVMIVLGEQVLPVIVPLFSQFAMFIGKIAQKFARLDPQMQKFIAISVGIAAGLGPTLTVIGAMATIIGALISPIALVIAAIAGTAGLVFVIVKNWDKIVKVTKEMFEGVKLWLFDKFNSLLIKVKIATEKVTGFFKDMWEKVVGNSIVPEMMEGIEKEFEKLDKIMVKPVEEATAKVTKLLEKQGPTLEELFAKPAKEATAKVAFSFKKMVIDIKKSLEDLDEHLAATFLDFGTGLITGKGSQKGFDDFAATFASIIGFSIAGPIGAAIANFGARAIQGASSSSSAVSGRVSGVNNELTGLSAGEIVTINLNLSNSVVANQQSVRELIIPPLEEAASLLQTKLALR